MAMLLVYVLLIDEETLCVVPSRRRISEEDEVRLKGGASLNDAFEAYRFASDNDRTRFREAIRVPGVNRVDLNLNRQGVRAFWLRVGSVTSFLGDKEALSEALKSRISTWLGATEVEVIYVV